MNLMRTSIKKISTITNHTLISQPLTWFQTLKKQPLTSSSACPKPSQIPYQPNLPTFINLFGVIQIPIQFHSTPDGQNIAATIIAQKDGAFIGNSSNSVFIPVVFQGDLAYSVAAHVKVHDCVYVTAKLSLSPLPFVLSQNQGEFYLVGNEIKFVHGLDVGNSNVVKEEVGEGKSSVDNGTKEASQDGGLKGDIEGFEKFELDGSTSVGVYEKLDELNLENKVEEKSVVNVGGTTKDADSVFNSWRDLVKNPMDWCDYREDKSIGLVKAKYPDFKHKINGAALWLNTAPNWVLAGLEGLNVGKGKKEDSWKNLVENPDKWWDKRLKKTNINAPDFIHKETGEGLWLHSSPKWVLAGLEGLNVEKGKKDDSRNPDKWLNLVKNPTDWWDYREDKSNGSLKARYPDFKHKTNGTALWLNTAPNWLLAGLEGLNLRKGKKEDSCWKNLVENPDKWWDNRPRKTNVNAPDFMHKKTSECLWLDSSPKWVLAMLDGLNVGKGKKEDSWKNLIENPDKWWDNRPRKTTNLKAPDFIHKETSEGLWLDSSPKWVLAGPEGPYVGKSSKEDSWKNLFENPDKWLDNRPSKINVNAPDFLHKETGEALWLNSSPKWVLSQVPSQKIEHNVTAVNKKACVT